MAFLRVEATPELRKYINTIFTDEFMKKNTNFTCFMDFQSSSSVFLNWNSFLWVYNEEVFDGFVKESTRFSSWEEMVKAAADEAFSEEKKAEQKPAGK